MPCTGLHSRWHTAPLLNSPSHSVWLRELLSRPAQVAPGWQGQGSAGPPQSRWHVRPAGPRAVMRSRQEQDSLPGKKHVRGPALPCSRGEALPVSHRTPLPRRTWEATKHICGHHHTTGPTQAQIDHLGEGGGQGHPRRLELSNWAARADAVSKGPRHKGVVKTGNEEGLQGEPRKHISLLGAWRVEGNFQSRY